MMHIEETTARHSEVEALIEEWRAARQAIFDCVVNIKTTPPLFDRLASAEYALMQWANRNKAEISISSRQ